ncbi:MAG TPA: hypothetical protein VJ140_05035 [Actinomycetota bacterium]|nr:hypothetical protein [Actinomycetota bacterium]
MSARRTPRQILLDSMAEVRDFMPEVERMVVEDYGGRCMHVHPATVRAGRTITPTSVPWPDLTIWFPDAPWTSERLHLVELKAHGGKLKRGQPELFASLERAGNPVPIWEPRDLDDKIPDALSLWSCRDIVPVTFMPKRRRPR